MEFFKNQQLLIIQENELDYETVIRKLFNDSEPILYISNAKNEYVGCITSGDFIKSINLPKNKWINYNGCKLIQDEKEQDKANDIFSNHPRIHNIPVLDSYGKLQYEYIRIKEGTLKDDFNCEFLHEVLFSQYLKDLGFHCILSDYTPTSETTQKHGNILSYCHSDKKRRLNETLYAEYVNISFCTISELDKKYQIYKKLYHQASHQAKKWIAKYHELFGRVRMNFSQLNRNILLMYEASMDYKANQILNLDSFYWYLYSWIKEHDFHGIASSRHEGILNGFIKKYPNIRLYSYEATILNNEKILYIYELDDKNRDCFYETNKKNCFIMILPLCTLLTQYLYSMMTGCVFANLNQQGITTYSIVLDGKLNKFLSSLDRDKRKPYGITHISQNLDEYREFLKCMFGENKEDKYLKQVFTIPKLMENESDETHHTDVISEYLNVIDGKRRTTNQPTDFTGSVHIFGACLAFGYGVEDGDTTSSYLQNILNENGEPYRVVNYGIWGGLNDLTYYRICNAKYQPHDIIIWLGWLSNIIPNQTIYSVSDIIAKNAEKNEYYDMPGHAGPALNHSIAEYLYQLIKPDFKKEKTDIEKFTIHNHYIKWKSLESKEPIIKELNKYKEKVSSFLPSKEDSQIIGSIVMNANPFTLGHQTLIETAAKTVNHLYVFVVEEDQSFFPFQDRFLLVQRGTKHISNITILPSGKCILSSLTFSGYFNKDEKETAVHADVAKDVKIFSQYIVPMFRIKKRFVGEEPFDILTNRYNQSLKDILPLYGVEVIEIPRKKNNETVISAGTVRRLMKQNRWNEVKTLVPDTTYEYLIKRLDYGGGLQQ